MLAKGWLCPRCECDEQVAAKLDDEVETHDTFRTVWDCLAEIVGLSAFDDYVDVDNKVESHNTLTDEEIVSQVIEQTKQDQDASDDETFVEPKKASTVHEAYQALDTVQRLILTTDHSEHDDILNMTSIFEQVLALESGKRTVQNKLTDFFKRD